MVRRERASGLGPRSHCNIKGPLFSCLISAACQPTTATRTTMATSSPTVSLRPRSHCNIKGPLFSRLISAACQPTTATRTTMATSSPTVTLRGGTEIERKDFVAETPGSGAKLEGGGRSQPGWPKWPIAPVTSAFVRLRRKSNPRQAPKACSPAGLLIEAFISGYGSVAEAMPRLRKDEKEARLLVDACSRRNVTKTKKKNSCSS
ncbi:hypothetical protein HPB48_022204 [Haemaphysalis longicornis]|uniref:Uncharacterized protein n=1 Tax=Haemaphysalis longicornis TaxID=44386 RepID=A0A9J6FUT8_HAELO|nr:hypothetical protein HPB48_022204 [Haemaphysalis longicornis]